VVAGGGLAHTDLWVTEQGLAWPIRHLWEAPLFTERTSVELDVHAHRLRKRRSVASLASCSKPLAAAQNRTPGEEDPRSGECRTDGRLDSRLATKEPACGMMSIVEVVAAELVRAGRLAAGTRDESGWFDRLDHVRAGVDAVVAARLEAGDLDAAIQLGAALWPYWVRRAADGKDWLDRMTAATATATASTALAELRYGAGLAAFRHGDTDASRSLNEAALSAAEDCASPRGRALAYIGLSRVSFRDGDYSGGLSLAAAAEQAAAEAGEDALRTTALHMRAELTRAQGRYDDAVPLYQRLLEADEHAGDPRSLAMEHYNLGSVLLQLDRLDDAERHLGTALDLSRTDAIDQLPYALLGMAGLAARRGDGSTAGQLLGAVEAHLEAAGEVLDPAERVEQDSHVAIGRRMSGTFDDARAAGRSLSLAEAGSLLP
jgi:tetratricopeptide (TPR) repeat protein